MKAPRSVLLLALMLLDTTGCPQPGEVGYDLVPAGACVPSSEFTGEVTCEEICGAAGSSCDRAVCDGVPNNAVSGRIYASLDACEMLDDDRLVDVSAFCSDAVDLEGVPSDAYITCCCR